MSNYNSNYEIAQAISERIGAEPIPFDSVYEICLQIYNELGGEPEQFDSVYEILLGILPLVGGGIASKVIDDTVITTNKTWSSSKINEEIQAVAGTANSDIEGKSTEDFHFVTELPQEAEEDEQVVIKGENTDTLYKYVSGAWVEQTPYANILYFDTENEALYSYVTLDHQFAPVSLVNTIVVGSNLNSNAALKAIKTPGVYSVVQRLHSASKGDYIKNWTLTVEGIDYDEYERTDSVYQRIQSNYTIQKRTWSSTRATNDGWSSFSTYYAGEIKDTTTSKYYTWSSNKLSTELGAKQNTLAAGTGISISGDTISCTVQPTPALEAGQNIEVADNKINALGYKTPKDVEFSVDNGYFGGGFSEFSIHNPIESASMSFLQTLPASMLPVTIKLSGAAGATSYVVNQDAWAFISQAGQMLVGYTFNTDKGSAKVSGIDTSTTSIVFESTINSTEALVEEEVVTLSVQNHIYISGSANTTTYSVSDDLGSVNSFLEFINSRRNLGAYTEINIDGYGVRMIISANQQNSTITLIETLDKNNPIDNVEVLSFADDYYTYDNLAISYNSHAEGFGTSAGGEIFINPITYDSSTRKLTTTQDLSQFLNAEGALKVFLPNNKSKVITINYIEDLGGGVYKLGPQNSPNLEDGTYYGILNYGQLSHAEGRFTTASGTDSHAEGSSTTASGVDSHAEGAVTTAQNDCEHAEGKFNVSHKSSNTYGNAGNTQHSVGIGTRYNDKKNAFEIMQNGDVYVYGVGGYQGTNTHVQDASIKTLQAYIASLEARITALEGNSTVE